MTKINGDGRLIGAICHASWVLIFVKILQDRKATSYFAIKGNMINVGCIFEDSSVVIDKNLITSRIPRDLPDLIREILKILEY